MIHLRMVADDIIPYTPCFEKIVVDMIALEDLVPRLTSREQNVVKGLMAGQKQREIAITIGCHRSNVSRIKKKLNRKDVAECLIGE